ncbi:MAG: dihydropteroate synthase [Acetobacteraceae bacterium]|nr:dihydropteroate synthase [Acetobacteraceae bacterium]
MGVLNLTPDSFSDGGAYPNPNAAIAAGLAMRAAGADIVDVGGESTRPGAVPVPPEEEQARVLPVIAALARAGVLVSADTRNAATMAAALDAGAAIINDVSALAHDPASAPLLARRDCAVVLMHMRGNPATMAAHADYHDVVAEVAAELGERVAAAERAGIARSRLVLDPGFGFAKRPEHSVALLRGLHRLRALGLPILVGISRKGFIGALAGEPVPARRDAASLAAALFALAQGAAVLRVHDVAGTAQAVRIWRALTDG